MTGHVVKRLKIEHPSRAFWWSCDLDEWTNDDCMISDWRLIEDDECAEIAARVGGNVEEFTTVRSMPDFYSRSLGAAIAAE
jgi:hypothetical protein